MLGGKDNWLLPNEEGFSRSFGQGREEWRREGEKSGDVRERQGRNTPKETAAEFPAEPPCPAAEGQIQILLYSILGLNLQQSA